MYIHSTEVYVAWLLLSLGRRPSNLHEVGPSLKRPHVGLLKGRRTTCTPKRGIQATSKVLSQPEQKEANRASRANDTDAATCLEGLLAEGGRHRWHHPQVHRSSDDALEHVGRRAANHPREGGVGGAHHARPSVSRPRLQPVYA